MTMAKYLQINYLNLLDQLVYFVLFFITKKTLKIFLKRTESARVITVNQKEKINSLIGNSFEN